MESAKTGVPRVLIERRKEPRYFINLPLDYRKVGSSKFRPGYTVDFFDGGLTIACVEGIGTGAEMEIKIYFGSRLDLVVIPAIAKVVWTAMETDENGFTRFEVSFLEISSEDLETLKALVKDYADPTTQPPINPSC